jgi:ParB-like nuclease domain
MKKDIFKKAIQKNTEAIPLSLLETESKIKKEFIIMDELRDFISPLSKEELEGLEQDIIKDGISDPLIIWETTTEVAGLKNAETKTVYVLIDGHNRYRISQKYNLDFRIILRNYKDVQEVKDSMLNKQLNRRNLTLEQISYYRGLKYNSVIKSQEGLPKTVNVAFNLAKEFKVNEKTIRRDAEFAKGLNKLSPELRQDVLVGKTKVNKSDIVNLAKVNTGETKSVSSSDEITQTIKKEKIEYPLIEDTIPLNINELESSIRELAMNKLDRQLCLILLDKINALMSFL